MPEVEKEQAVFLEELRSSGVLAMVEEAVGAEVSPGFSCGTREGEWHAWVQDYPAILDNDSWDRTLRIVLWSNPLREFEQQPQPYMLKYKNRVIVHYNSQRILSIEGATVTFSGPIPENEREKTFFLEEAFAKALLAPKRAEIHPRHHDHEIVVGAR